MRNEHQKQNGLSRRTVIKSAAWSVPVIAAAVATPLAAASGVVDLGAFALSGSCGILGLLGPGFSLQAGPTEPLPAGMSVIIIGSGVADIGVFTPSGGTADVTILSSTSRQISLTAPLPAGTTIDFRSTLSISVAFAMNAVATIPPGFDATGAKTAGNVSSTLVLCTAN